VSLFASALRTSNCFWPFAEGRRVRDIAYHTIWPALAKQLGHGLRVFFDVHAKWINSKKDREEIAKLDQAIQSPPNCPQTGQPARIDEL
jgi:hypothetical protein